MDNKRITTYADTEKYENMFPEERQYSFRISNRITQLDTMNLVMFDVWQAVGNDQWKCIHTTSSQKEAEQFMFDAKQMKKQAESFQPKNWLFP